MDTQEHVTRVRLTLDHDYRFVTTYPDLPEAPQIHLDEPSPLGGGHGPNPAALIATTVGNCLASSLLFCARKARISIEHLNVNAEAHIARNADGRYRLQGVHVTLTPELANEDRARLQRCQAMFEDFCIVTAAVRDGIDVQVEVNPQPVVESAA